MDEITITYLVLGAVVVLFVTDAFAVEITALGAALTLYATGVLELEQSLAGFSDPAVLLIAALFVVSEGLDATGVTTWAGQFVLAHARDSQQRLLVLVMCLVAALTALISVNGAVASLLPMVVIVAVRSGASPSRLLLPLAFGAHAGSMLALTGTPVNVLVSDAAADAGSGAFEFFEFTLVGVPLVLGTIVVVATLGPRLIPDRTPASLPTDLSEHASSLARQYLDERRVCRLVVPDDGAAHAEVLVDEDEHPTVSVVGVQTGGHGALNQGLDIEPRDVVIVMGEMAEIEALAGANGLDFDGHSVQLGPGGELLDRAIGVAEIIIPPRSELIGRSVFPGMASDDGEVLVLAIQRRGDDLGPGATALEVGDTLLVQGRWTELDERMRPNAGVVSVDEPDAVRRQAVPRGVGSTRAIAILAAMVVLLATGWIPAVVAGLLAAVALIVTRVLPVQQAYKGIGWTTVVLVAAMFPLSTAMTQTGAADQIASGLVRVVGDSSPHVLLIGLFVIVAVLGQLISNMATALIVIPVGVSAAAELDVSVRPVLMCITVAAAAALLTPVATPANLMVMSPAGYRFGDYARLGLPLMGVFAVVAIGIVPLIWGF